MLWEFQPELSVALLQRGYESYVEILPVSEIQPYDIVALDDLIHERKNSQDVTTMLTQAAHHEACFIIFIMQNLFPPGRGTRTRSLKTHCYANFKNCNKSQVEFLARQVLPRNPKVLIEAFDTAREKPHSYLFFGFDTGVP